MTAQQLKELQEALRLSGQSRFEEAQEIVDAQKKKTEEYHG